MAGYEREVRRTQRAQDIAVVAEGNRLLVSLLEVHTGDFPPATPRQAEAAPVNADAVTTEHVDAALHGISVLKRNARRAAREHAQAEAQAAITELWLKREQQLVDDQEELDEAWKRLQDNEPETVLAALEAAFEDNEFPAAPLDCAGEDIFLLVTLPSRDAIVPERKVGQTPSGKPTIVRRTKTEQNALYLGMIASAVIATCKESFAVAPGAKQATVLVIRNDDLAQMIAPLALFSLDRATITDAGSVDCATALDLLNRTPVVINPRGRAHDLEPLDPGAAPGLPEVLERLAGGLGLRAVGASPPTSDDADPSSLRDAATALTAALKTSTPQVSAVEHVPILGDDVHHMSFMAFETARLQLSDEYASATTADAKFEAGYILTWLRQQQIESLTQAMAYLQDRLDRGLTSELSDADRVRSDAYVLKWFADPKQTTAPLIDEQNRLADELGRARCERIVNERATPRLESLRQQLLENLEARQAELRAAEGIKVCPDCAEEIKSDARVCRFCGFRFERPPPSA